MYLCKCLIEYRYETEGYLDWAWTKALLDYKDFGGDDLVARNSLYEAVKVNGIVVKHLIGEACMVLSANINFVVDIGDGSGQRKMEAKDYFDSYMIYWRRIKGAIEWVRDLGVKYREKLYTGQYQCGILSVMTHAQMEPTPCDDIPLD